MQSLSLRAPHRGCHWPSRADQAQSVTWVLLARSFTEVLS